MSHRYTPGWFSLIPLLFSFSLHAQTVVVQDDAGHVIKLPRPANRIISLSPHATELLFAAGASDQVVATVSYSDYPEAAKKIPRIGSHQKIDLEAVVALKPDLVIGWKDGGATRSNEAIEKLGINIYYSEPYSFGDITRNIINMGQILGTEAAAQKKAAEFTQALSRLRKQYRDHSPVSVFYQVWNRPLMTINNDHIITRVIEFCGGSNIFSELAVRAPRVGIEAVIKARPEAIIIGSDQARSDWVNEWQRWKNIPAVKHHNVYTVNADTIVRQTPRVLQGIQEVCSALQQVRKKR